MSTLLMQREIDQFSHTVKANNPFFQKVFSGTLEAEHLARFLYTAYYLTLHTPIHLHLAKDVASSRGQDKLVKFFEEKINEEFGHDIWAAQDLQNLMHAHGMKRFPEPVDGVKRLVRFIEQKIQEDPSLYLPYILLAEYFTVTMGKQWTEHLKNNPAIKNAQVSIVTKHIELDEAHVQHDIAVLDTLFCSERTDEYIETLKESFEVYDQVYREFGE